MPHKEDSPPSGGHSFHIPVMGTAFTIDTPLKVARYGISSTLSLVDDVLIEKMRRLHSRLAGEDYSEIGRDEDDSRARRITSYLDLLDRSVRRQIGQLKDSVFEKGSELTRYFEMLPESPLKAAYRRMQAATDLGLKRRLQEGLRKAVSAGRIDVNIMTKLDRDNFRRGAKLPEEFSDAMAALRGFARSRLRASLVLSAGLNRRLFSYIAKFDDFFPDERGDIRKQIVLKVSDFRSAVVQGKLLARLGLWVSEFRVESGLNCGGHAFATPGLLMGPILEEFRLRREALADQLFGACREAAEKAGRPWRGDRPAQRLTVQGGIGTHEEDDLLLHRFGVDGTGWGTPFLLVPEAVNIDAEHRDKLARAEDDDVCLSEASPLGIPFWSLRNSASEEVRRGRIEQGKPGSSCPKGYLAFDSEFSRRPICTASRAYQRRKLEALEHEDLTPEQRRIRRESILAKSCICNDLSGCAPRSAEDGEGPASAVCCGPNIVNFHRSFTLREMVDHIYGQNTVLEDERRPHMFIRELSLYVEFLRKELASRRIGLGGAIKSLREYRDNLMAGIEFYRELARGGLIRQRDGFQQSLASLAAEIEELVPAADPA